MNEGPRGPLEINIDTETELFSIYVKGVALAYGGLWFKWITEIHPLQPHQKDTSLRVR